MKLLLVTIALAMFFSVEALTPAEKEIVVRYYKECYGETGADSKLTKKAKGGDFDFEDDKVKNFFFCMNKKVGIMNEQGVFLKKEALSKLDKSLREQREKVIDKCVAQKGKSPADTAWLISKCYDKEIPGQEDFF